MLKCETNLHSYQPKFTTIIDFVLRPSARFLCQDQVRSRNKRYLKTIQFDHLSILPCDFKFDTWN